MALASCEPFQAAFVSQIVEDLTVLDVPTTQFNFLQSIIENVILDETQFPRGWFRIDDDQIANWAAINNSQTVSWSAINNNQTQNWANIVDTQSANWNNIDTTQSPNWTAIDDSQ